MAAEIDSARSSLYLIKLVFWLLFLWAGASLLLLLPAGRGGKGKMSWSWESASEDGGGGSSVLLHRRSGRVAWWVVSVELRRSKTAAVPLQAGPLHARAELPVGGVVFVPVNLAGRGGEGGEGNVDDGADFSSSLLPNRASSTVAFIAAGISGRVGPASRLVGVSSTSRREAFQGSSAGVPHRLLAKWSVPGDKTMAGVVVPSTVEEEDWITFYLFFQGLPCLIPGPVCTFLFLEVLYVNVPTAMT